VQINIRKVWLRRNPIGVRPLCVFDFLMGLEIGVWISGRTPIELRTFNNKVTMLYPSPATQSSCFDTCSACPRQNCHIPLPHGLLISPGFSELNQMLNPTFLWNSSLFVKAPSLVQWGHKFFWSGSEVEKICKSFLVDGDQIDFLRMWSPHNSLQKCRLVETIATEEAIQSPDFQKLGGCRPFSTRFDRDFHYNSMTKARFISGSCDAIEP
jgi:hypothetical protein